MREAMLSIVFGTVACRGGGNEAAPFDAALRQVVTDEKQLHVGELAEGILTGGPSDMALIQLSAPAAAFDWNLHGHAGGTTMTINEELGVMKTTYAFTPSSQADWYLLVRNRNAALITVEVELDLYGAMHWSGWQ